jgi:hypothetical protein
MSVPLRQGDAMLMNIKIENLKFEIESSFAKATEDRQAAATHSPSAGFDLIKKLSYGVHP